MAIATRPKPNTHARKRQAGHHRQNKRYLQSYWPYLPMLLVVGLGLLVNSVWTKNAVLGAQTGFSTASLLSDTNEQRTRNGETPLSLNAQLDIAAQAKANDMVRADYWAHNSPGDKTPWSFIAASGYNYQSAGENLAYGFADASDSVNGWMNSPEHRANILNNSYQDVGFGIANSPDYQGQGPKTVVVAEYAQPAVVAASNVLGAHSETPSQPVARIQTLSAYPAWGLAAVIVVSGLAMALFILRHGYRVHRLLNQGEMLMVQHPYLDIGIVAIITVGCLLTRTGGIIR